MIKTLKTLTLILLFNSSLAHSEIFKPNKNIEPHEVIKIQLNGLKKNDSSYKDSGIEQTWEFAHPNNKIFTGPLDRFKQMIKGESYKMLLNHRDHKISELYSDKNKAVYEVIVMDDQKKYFMFKWQVEKYLKVGPLQNCWLTTLVSTPVPMGPSI